MNRGIRRALTAILAVACAVGCQVGCQPASRDRGASGAPGIALTPCHLTSHTSGEVIAAKCGTLEVWEDRDAKRGRRISLRVAVVPASGGREPAADALVVLAGGPGQAATDVYPGVAPYLARVHAVRDIVLVDQRGTGASHRLSCPPPEAEVEEAADEATAAELWSKRCREHLEADADLRMYTTRIAADDLDDVRAALGYESLDLYGGSYGTRAALVYARRYPSRVRAMILDGVAPPDWTLGASMAADAQRAVSGLFAECAADAACARAFPDPARDLETLLHRLEAAPVDVVVPHPATAVATHVRLTRAAAASVVRSLSYERAMAALIPLLVHEAVAGDLRPLAGQVLLWRDAVEVAVGMHFAVACTEDAPFLDAARLTADRDKSYCGSEGLSYVHVCKGWPRGALDAADRAPVVSDVPTLLLSGELDPVTPPANAEAAARTLHHALSIVVPGSGHGALVRGCLPRVAAEFLKRGAVDGLDTSCVPRTHDVRFFTSFTGPPP